VAAVCGDKGPVSIRLFDVPSCPFADDLTEQPFGFFLQRQDVGADRLQRAQRPCNGVSDNRNACLLKIVDTLTEMP
jgi:hypothetical protein